MWRRRLLLLWAVGLLAPAAWLAQAWPPLQRAFNWFFGPPWMHILSHALLFAGLAYLLGGLLAGSGWPRRRGGVARLTLLLALLAGLGQEGLQLWTQARPFTRAEVFDLAVDLTGAGLGLLLLQARRRNVGDEEMLV